MSLARFYETMIEEEEEMQKVAAEEEAAGRIAARGFLDELNKLAQQVEGSREEEENK